MAALFDPCSGAVAARSEKKKKKRKKRSVRDRGTASLSSAQRPTRPRSLLVAGGRVGASWWKGEIGMRCPARSPDKFENCQNKSAAGGGAADGVCFL
jgi:hypothetical protein